MERIQWSELLECLLQRLEEGPTVPVEGKLVTIKEVFVKVLDMLVSEQLCACHIFELVQAAVATISAQYTGDNNLQTIKELTDLGVLLLEVVARYVIHEGLAVTGAYENISFLAVSLLTPWRSGLYQHEALTPLLKEWIVHVLESPVSCPNVFLRLEMLRLIAMWTPEDFINDEEFGSHAAAGIMHHILDLKVTFLLPKGHTGLLWSLKKSLQLLQDSGYFRAYVMRSYTFLKNLIVDRIEQSMAYLIVLMGRAAKRVLRLRHSGDLTPVGTVDQLTSILRILRLLVATPRNMEPYEQPGICNLAATAIARTCRCIMLIPDAPVSRRIYAKLVLEVNDFFLAMDKFQVKGTIVEELRRYHCRCLSFVAARMKKLGFTELTLPEPLHEARQDVPWNYIDWRSGRIMETPLRITTGEVIDRSTLLVLMLSAPFNKQMHLPLQDLTFEPMPELHQEIRVWKEQQQEHHHEEECQEEE